jgi:hypothetical protein
VVLSNVKIEGSDATGESVEATATATIINTSNISLTNVELTVGLYYNTNDARFKVFYSVYHVFLFIDICGFSDWLCRDQSQVLLSFLV